MASMVPNFGKFRITQYTLDEKCSTYWKTFIHAIKKITAFLEVIFAKLPTSQTHFVEISRAKFKPKLSTNMESTGRNPSNPTCKV